MEKLIRTWLMASAALTYLGAAQSLTDNMKLTVVIYDQVRIRAETLEATERAASTIFARTGVQVVWRDGFAYAAERRDVLTPPPEDPATLVVKLQPESAAARYGVGSMCGGIGVESSAIIFVRRFDATWLGPIVAHELGHILLGPNSHSNSGIMRGTLLPRDWVKATQGTLDFNRSQSKQIRAWIAERSRPRQ